MILKTFLAKAKAFTLFTAMVSFIIIGISVIVMQHISNSEQNYNQIITSLQNQQEMESAKDLIRLDTLRVFDVLYRAKFYDVYGAVAHDVGLGNDNWVEFRNDYIRETFFGGVYEDKDTPPEGSKFADYMSNKILVLLFNYSGNFKGEQYFFRVYGYAECRLNNNCDPLNPSGSNNTVTTYITNALSNSFLESYRTGNFLELVDCADKQDECNNGSFYTNIYGNLISNENYLNMPRIIIRRIIDNSAMDDAIFPRNTVSMYMPMRLFGALALVRESLKDPELTEELSELKAGTYYDSLKCENGFQLKEQNNKDFNYDSIAPIINSEKNRLELRYNKVTNPMIYTSKVFIVKTDGAEIQKFVEYKLSSLNIDVNLTDLDSSFTFGRTTESSFQYKGTILLNSSDKKIEYTICKCDISPENTFGTLINCKPELSKNGTVNAEDDLRSQLKANGITEADIKSIIGPLIGTN